MRSDIDFDRLGITDDLMFGTVFQDPNLCQGLIELLLGIEVEKIEFVERQGLLDAGPLSRAGIDDLLVRDAAGNEYDVEMQNVATPGIARRARRYLTLVDTNMLDRGQRFEDAGNAIVIFICANDPFWPGLEALRLHAGLRSGRAALGRRHQHRVRERSGRARGLLRRIRCLPALSLE